MHAEVLVPESELAFATAAERASEPFAAYLLRHLSAETPQGAAWKVEVRSVRNMSPTSIMPIYRRRWNSRRPQGASARAFVLIDDAVTHEVRNHVVLVLALGAANPEVLGASAIPGAAPCRSTHPPRWRTDSTPHRSNSRMSTPTHTVLVLGAYGFFGSRICAALAKNPRIRLILTGRDHGEGHRRRLSTRAERQSRARAGRHRAGPRAATAQARRQHC